jgi:hypothetical protein
MASPSTYCIEYFSGANTSQSITPTTLPIVDRWPVHFVDDKPLWNDNATSCVAPCTTSTCTDADTWHKSSLKPATSVIRARAQRQGRTPIVDAMFPRELEWLVRASVHSPAALSGALGVIGDEPASQ